MENEILNHEKSQEPAQELPEEVQRAIGYMQALIDALELAQTLTAAQTMLLAVAQHIAVYEESES